MTSGNYYGGNSNEARYLNALHSAIQNTNNEQSGVNVNSSSAMNNNNSNNNNNSSSSSVIGNGLRSGTGSPVSLSALLDEVSELRVEVDALPSLDVPHQLYYIQKLCTYKISLIAISTS